LEKRGTPVNHDSLCGRGEKNVLKFFKQRKRGKSEREGVVRA